MYLRLQLPPIEVFSILRLRFPSYVNELEFTVRILLISSWVRVCVSCAGVPRSAFQARNVSQLPFCVSCRFPLVSVQYSLGIGKGDAIDDPPQLPTSFVLTR